MLVLPHPCDARWERTTSHGSPALSAEEIEAIHDFVRGGGGLLVISEYEHDKYGDNLNALLAPAGLRIENGTAFDRSACVHENAEWLLAEPTARSPLSHGVTQVCFYRAGWCVAEGDARIAWQTSAQWANPPHAGLVGIAPFGAGRVALVTDSVLFGGERIGEFQHEQLWLNLLYWLAAPGVALRSAQRLDHTPPSGAWARLKSTINQLRTMQNADGSVPTEGRQAAAQLVSKTIEALAVRSARNSRIRRNTLPSSLVIFRRG